MQGILQFVVLQCCWDSLHKKAVSVKVKIAHVHSIKTYMESGGAVPRFKLGTRHGLIQSNLSNSNLYRVFHDFRA